MTALPVPAPKSQPDPSENTNRAAPVMDVADYPTIPLPPTPRGVADEITQDDLIDLARMQTRRLLPLRQQAEMREMLRLLRDGHATNARRLARCVAEDERSIAQLFEVADSYRAQEYNLASIPSERRTPDDLRRLRILHNKLRELERDLATLCLSRDDHERQRQEHARAAASIGRSLRPVMEGTGQ